jgi:CRP-like cAMP-binding protein
MFSIHAIDPCAPLLSLAYGQLLLRRGAETPLVSFIETGHVALGVLENGVMDHQIGVLEGPCWLDASSVLLGLPHLVDAVADSAVRLRQVPIQDFKKSIDDLPEYARSVLLDVALAHRKQTEYAVSRLAKDAEARCAEWLLSHAKSSDQGVMAVQLQQRKRSIAVQLGIAPETFSRVLRHLREQSLISGSGRVLNLLNPKALRSLAGI